MGVIHVFPNNFKSTTGMALGVWKYGQFLDDYKASGVGGKRTACRQKSTGRESSMNLSYQTLLGFGFNYVRHIPSQNYNGRRKLKRAWMSIINWHSVLELIITELVSRTSLEYHPCGRKKTISRNA
uniref:Uncharacterized protein n=1 Tax=Bionectria ochroleuca TaxID=29856 RepID=A0A8H7TNU1_BIOOC